MSDELPPQTGSWHREGGRPRSAVCPRAAGVGRVFKCAPLLPLEKGWRDCGAPGGTTVVLAGSVALGVSLAGASLGLSPAPFATCSIGLGMKDCQRAAPAARGRVTPCAKPQPQTGVGWEEVPSGLLQFKKGLLKRDLIVHV